MSTGTEIATGWLDRLGEALSAGDAAAAAALFGDGSYWRDLVSLTWNITTMEGPAEIRAMLEATLADARPSGWVIDGEATEADGVTEAWLTFETPVASCRGHVRLIGGKAWTLLTTLQQIKGFEEKLGANRARGLEHGAVDNRRSWLDLRLEEESELGYSRQPFVVIVGGGQGGIALGARLRSLDVPTIIVEKNERAGDSWRKRYASLCLHDPVWYDHLPYIPFPDHWPVFSPKDKLADWLEMYTKVMELNYWTSSTVSRASYDDGEGEWTITVDRNGETVVLRPRHLVLATGMAGRPRTPDFEGAETFRGDQRHSSRYGSGEEYTGRTVVVIGSGNSAHDICADLQEHGADVTMVQRSPTTVARSDTLVELALGDLYSERAVAGGVTTDVADLVFASLPYAALGPLQVPLYEAIADADATFYQELEKAGFLLDWGEDGSGLFMKYLRRGSGYYIDVGASQMIIDGKIDVAAGSEVARITGDAVVLEDGRELPADAIIYATGYGPMNGWAEELISKDVAERVGRVWGLGSGTTYDPGPWEGELRNMWKPTRQEGLWFQGGNLHQARHYSQFLALQLKARFEGIATPVYGLPEVLRAT